MFYNVRSASYPHLDQDYLIILGWSNYKHFELIKTFETTLFY